jgi:ATP-binding cassette subfamily B (MDR/TAP) protein 1
MVATMFFNVTFEYIEAFSKAKGAAAKIFSVIDSDSRINILSEDGKRPEQMNGNICFRDVHFRYPTRPDIEVSKSHTLCLIDFLWFTFIYM